MLLKHMNASFPFMILGDWRKKHALYRSYAIFAIPIILFNPGAAVAASIGAKADSGPVGCQNPFRARPAWMRIVELLPDYVCQRTEQ
jgi:hypothetical protein